MPEINIHNPDSYEEALAAAINSVTDVNTITDAEKSAVVNLPEDTNESLAGKATSAQGVLADSALQPDMGGATVTNYGVEPVTLSGAAVVLPRNKSGANIYLEHTAAMTAQIPDDAAAGESWALCWAGDGQPQIITNGTLVNADNHTRILAKYRWAFVTVRSNSGSAPVCYFSGETAA